MHLGATKLYLLYHQCLEGHRTGNRRILKTEVKWFQIFIYLSLFSEPYYLRDSQGRFYPSHQQLNFIHIDN